MDSIETHEPDDQNAKTAAKKPKRATRQKANHDEDMWLGTNKNCDAAENEYASDENGSDIGADMEMNLSNASGDELFERPPPRESKTLIKQSKKHKRAQVLNLSAEKAMQAAKATQQVADAANDMGKNEGGKKATKALAQKAVNRANNMPKNYSQCDFKGWGS